MSQPVALSGQMPVRIAAPQPARLFPAPDGKIYPGPARVAVAAALMPAAGTLSLVAPPAGAVVPSARPAFTVTVAGASAGTRVQITYAPAAGAAGAAMVAADAPAGLDGVPVTLQPVGSLADGRWWWSARLVSAIGAGPWTPEQPFDVSAGDGAAVIGGSWTVDPDARAYPHLWWPHPGSGGDTGEQVLLAGTGFGPAPRVLLDGAAIDATATAYPTPSGPDDGRTADAVTGEVTGWYHELAAFTLPALDPDTDGGAVTVERGD